MRLLVCGLCKTCEELPDYIGPLINNDDREYPGKVPPDGYDVLLDRLVERHPKEGHANRPGERSPIALFHIDDEAWAKEENRHEILKALGRDSRGAFDAEWYDTKSTFQYDALQCYNTHQRPKQGCIDFQDDRKLLGGTVRNNGRDDTRVYLCSFCPVSTYVVTELRHKKGMYRE